MNIINFSNLESQVLNVFNEGKKTFDDIVEAISINEKTLETVLSGLIAKSILRLNVNTNEYEYLTKVTGEIVILDGNLLLPTTVIKLKDKMLVTRGDWYEFPLDFDIRRIIWNVKLESKTNSTLVDLIRTSVLKDKKSKIIQLKEYESLVNKIVPYSPNIGLLIHCVGENVTDISILFRIKIDTKNLELTAEHKGFSVRSEINTEELIEQLKTPIAERDYKKIKLNQIHNFTDFIFSKNEIPMSLANNELTFLKISGIKKTFEFSYYKMDVNGTTKKLDVEIFENQNEAIEKIRDIFKGLPQMILAENNFMIEMSE